MMQHPHAAAPRTLTLSVREARLIVDRILLTLGIPQGMCPSVRNVILTSQALGHAGFIGLGDDGRLAALRVGADRLPRIAGRDGNANTTPMPITDTNPGALPLHIDAQGAHAWLVLPAWADMLAVTARHAGMRHSRIDGVYEPAELACIVPMAARYGVGVTVRPDETGASVEVLHCVPPPSTLAERDPLLMKALRHGFAVSETLWWPLYEASKKALSPDSVTSRRHAGPTIVQDDGTIIGRAPADDDTDLTLLKRLN